jgi:serine/threonine-protein kinase
VRLTDFGVAKAALRAANTEEGQRKGKLLYMAPEQLAGGAVDARADLFALGATAFELWTGTRPFAARTGDRAASPSIDAAALETLSDGIVAGPLAEVLASAMASDPDARPVSADALREAIEACVEPAEPGAFGRYVEAAAPRALDRVREAVRATEAAAYEHVATVSTWSARDGASRFAEPTTARAAPVRAARGPGWVTTLAAVGLGGLGVAWGIAQDPPSSKGTNDVAEPAAVEPDAVASAPLRAPPPATALDPATSPPPSPASRDASPADSARTPSAQADTRPSVRAALVPPKPGPATSPTASPAASPPSTPDRCQPPYVVDASGVRTYKPECL